MGIVKEKSLDLEVEEKLKILRGALDFEEYLKCLEKEDDNLLYKIKNQGNKIYIHFPTSRISGDENEVIDEKDTKNFIRVVNKFRRAGIETYFVDGSTPEQALIASRKINDWVNEIKSAKCEGRELTQFEKYLYAYDIATSFVYNRETHEENSNVSRGLIQVLNGDKIVCTGFANILRHILIGLDIPCAKLTLIPTNKLENQAKEKGEEAEGHDACYVYLNDTKTGFKGGFIADPTAGSPMPSIHREKNIDYSMMSIQTARELYIKNDLQLTDARLEEAKRNCFYSTHKNFDKSKSCIKYVKDLKSKIELFTKSNLIDKIKKDISSAIFYEDLINKKEGKTISKLDEKESNKLLHEVVDLITKEIIINGHDFINKDEKEKINQLVHSGISLDEICDLIETNVSHFSLREYLELNHVENNDITYSEEDIEMLEKEKEMIQNKEIDQPTYDNKRNALINVGVAQGMDLKSACKFADERFLEYQQIMSSTYGGLGS